MISCQSHYHWDFFEQRILDWKEVTRVNSIIVRVYDILLKEISHTQSYLKRE